MHNSGQYIGKHYKCILRIMQIRLTCLFDTVNKNTCIDYQENHLPSIDYLNVVFFV